MRNIPVFLFSWLFTVAGAYSQAPAIEWQRTIGGNSQDAIFSAIQTTDGGYLLGGYSSSNISGEKSDNSQGLEDYWIVKIDGLGNILWDKTYGGDSTDYLQKVIQTNDGGYLLGGYTYSSNSGDKTDTAKGGWDTWIIKVDANGNKQWDKSYGGDEKDGLVAMKQTVDGNYLFWAVSKTGINGDKTEASRGLSDFWIVKIDTIGNILWDKTIGSNNMDHILSVQENADGGYILGGFTMSGISGDKTTPNFGFWDFWLVKLDASRNVEWDKSFGGTSSEHVMSVKEMSSGGYLLAGFSSSGVSGNKTEPSRGIYDYWIVRTDDSGNKLWEKAYGGTSAEEMRGGINMTNNGNLILGGFSQSGIGGEKTEANRGMDDYWLIKTDTSGTIIWDKTIGGSGTEFLYSVIPTTDNGYLVAGWSDSPISGEKTDSSRGSFDFWIVKLAPDFTTVGLNELVDNNGISVTVYPNPFSNTTTLQINTIEQISDPLTLSIYDITGKKVKQINNITENQLVINRENLSSGLYIYLLKNNNTPLANGKLIIQ
jgi:Secretion system C-terminal sorting domain